MCSTSFSDLKDFLHTSQIKEDIQLKFVIIICNSVYTWFKNLQFILCSFLVILTPKVELTLITIEVLFDFGLGFYEKIMVHIMFILVIFASKEELSFSQQKFSLLLSEYVYFFICLLCFLQNDKMIFSLCCFLSMYIQKINTFQLHVEYKSQL